MTTTVYAAQAIVESDKIGAYNSTNYDIARAGSTLSVFPSTPTAGSGADGQAGQFFNPVFALGSIFNLFETFADFDLTAVASVSSVTFEASFRGNLSVTDFTIEARSHAFTFPAVASDWIPGANLGSDPLVATLASTAIPTPDYPTAGYNTQSTYVSFTDNGGALLAACQAAAGGHLQISLSSDRLRTDTIPAATFNASFEYAFPNLLRLVMETGGRWSIGTLLIG